MEAFNIMKTKFILMVLTIFVMSFGITFGQAISLDSVVGTMWHGQPDSIMTGESYVFNIRVNNNGNVIFDTTFYGDPSAPDSIKIDTVTAMTGITNGFRVYSPDGATWTTTVGDTTGVLGGTQFDLIFSINPWSITGSDADTVGFGGASLFASGIDTSFNDVTYTITIGPITGGAAAHGKTICLDSAFYRSSGTWKWAAPGNIEAFPTWDGPHCYTVVDEATDITDGVNGLPATFGLAQNYPNPFNPTTNIDFSLPVKSDVTLTIYNITGQLVKEFSNTYDAGNQTISWDASSVASGIYFYKLTAGDYTATKKMMLLK